MAANGTQRSTEAEHLTGVLETMRFVNKLFAVERNTLMLAQKIATVLTRNMSYHNTWISLLDDNGAFVSMAESGMGDHAPAFRKLFNSGSFPSCMEKALESSEVVVHQDPCMECTDCLLSPEYTGRSGFTCALRYNDRILGVLSASVPRDYAQSPKEKELFTELAGDISQGLYLIRLEEKNLAEEREKAAILDSISDAMITLDSHGVITYFNKAASELLGVPADKVVGRHVGEVFPEGTDSIFSRKYEEALRTGEPVHFETHFDVEPYSNWYDLRLYPDSEGRVSIYFTVTTEKRLAEAELRENQERFELTIEGAELATWDWNVQSGRVKFNHRWAEMLGYTLEEIEHTAEQWETLIHPDERESVMEALSEHMKGNTPAYRTEHRLRHRDGSWIWVIDSGRVIKRDSNGKPLRGCGIHIDITERKNREARIGLLSEMLDSAPASITVHDLKGRFLYANRATVELHEYDSEQEFMGVNLHRLDVPESMEKIQERMNRIQSEGQASFQSSHYRKDGTEFPLHVMAKMISWNDEPAMLSVASDISERLQAQKALQESEERFRALVEHSPYAIMLLQRGRYIYCNPEGARILGLNSPDDIVGMDPLKLIAPEYRESIRSRIRNAAPGVSNPPLEIGFVLHDGSRRYSSSVSVSVTMQGKPTTIIVGEDITEKKKVQQEKKRLEERFQQFQRLESVGRLAGGVAHDLNNLLTPILGYGEMLNKDWQGGTEEKRKLEQILGAGERARDLVHQLLAFSRKQTLEFTALDINQLLRGFSTLLRRTISEDIGISYHLSKEPLIISGDRGQLEQVVMNLAINARDAMPDGGVLSISTREVSVNGKISYSEVMREGEYCSLQFADTGIGMDESVCSQIFEPFYTTKGIAKGTGLGLSTVYGIVKQHGGYIWANSEKGRGTVFSVFLPLSPDEATEPLIRNRQDSSSGSETVLLVEDDDQVRALATEMLSAAGYKVLAASNGEGAMDQMEKHGEKLSLLVTDVVMPGYNGREIYDMIAKKKPSMKVLYMSGYPDDVITSRGIVDHGVNFIQKPFTAGALTEKVRKILDS